MSNERFVVEVGGINFCSTRQTLSKSPCLKRLIECLSPESDYLFVDREGSSFVFILNFLRTKLIFQDLYDRSYVAFLIEEAKFYEIKEMEELLESILSGL
jgi:hypothetical protein